MDSSVTALLGFFEPRRAAGRSLVLATVVATEGSTYRKAGARMLIDGDGSACGLLSGGCLETDLLERARAVIASGAAQLVEYDLRTSNDPIWGLGLGCEGAMSILLQRLDPADDFRPLNRIVAAARQHRRICFATIVRSTSPVWRVGACLFEDDVAGDGAGRTMLEHLRRVAEARGSEGLLALEADTARITVFFGAVEPPPHIVILGAGPDAMPVSRAAQELGWTVSVYDHRPAYATTEHFPGAKVIAAPAEELHTRVDLSRFDAAVVMSHHLTTDLQYLGQLAESRVRYVGLLGPLERRRRLASELGARAAALTGRLHGPVGLDIGARTPEAIALAIVAEIHAVLAGRGGQPFSTRGDAREPWT
jgi:xanthine/CO dehydrogenase XdhC/CoxF family maturation factor